jgi:hypothetical protein
MKRLILCGVLLGAASVFAQDAGTLAQDAGVLVQDAGMVVAAVVPSLDQPLTSAKGFYLAVKEGQGWLAAMFILFFLVGSIRTAGKWLHGLIPDDTTNWLLRPVESVLRFIFDTRIGGWLLNWTSAIGGCLSTAFVAGLPVDAAAWKVAILASTGGTVLIELKGDILDWWEKRQAAKVAESAAKTTAVASSPPAV